MAKFYGVIGYVLTKEKVIEHPPETPEGDPVFETVDGVWIDEVIEKSYTGDVIRNRAQWRSGDNVNPDFTITDNISIIADGFILENMYSIKYVKWRNAAWSVTNVVVERPRVILEIGGLYNGQKG